MKVVFITPVTPYKENMGGPSGHPYHLMVERPEDIDITVYSYNNNRLSKDVIRQVEQELGVEIRLLEQPRWSSWILKFHLTFIRLLMKYPIGYYIRIDQNHVKEIKQLNPDLIWGYGQEFSGILKQFKEYCRLHTVPDCYTLHFYRRLGLRQTMSDLKEFWRVMSNYRKYYRMERNYDAINNIVYHLVGEEDKNFLLEINPKLNAHFVRHPRYELGVAHTDTTDSTDKDAAQRRFHSPKIRLLIAGRYDLYMQQAADELFEELKNGRIEELKNHYSITFLGKGWEKHVESLRQAGWDVEHITFATDYIEEISKHDIQITPIAIGTGTKGKVLDALANGLLVIGTPYAMENIAVENGVSCIEYRQPQEVIEVLKDILASREKYEAMAKAGQEAVLKWHDRGLLAREVFGLKTLKKA